MGADSREGREERSLNESGGEGVLGKAVGLGAVDVRANGGEAEVLKGEFACSGANFTAGSGGGATSQGVETVPDVGLWGNE